MTTKDHFSRQAGVYARSRPKYPAELYEFLYAQCKHRELAWDCGTGNGQVAVPLAGHFRQVMATDISLDQLKHAPRKENITYRCAAAGESGLPGRKADLVTVAQAIHWFDRDLFYREVCRVGKPGAVLAIWGYGLLSINPPIDKLIMDLYRGTLGPYWDPERKHIEARYRSIPFPFEEIPCPSFEIVNTWTLSDLLDYLRSWSALQHYIRKHREDPLPAFQQKLLTEWPEDEEHVARFPVFMRAGFIP